MGALAIRCSGDVQRCWEGSRRSHDGEVAPGHVAGKKFHTENILLYVREMAL